jgi:uncharacterized protein (DUF433 family)
LFLKQIFKENLMTGRPLVATREDAIANILSFRKELESSVGLQRIIGYSPCWYVLNDSEGYGIAPSKWVGYLRIDADAYLANNGAHDGRETEKVLHQWFEEVPCESAEHRQLLRVAFDLLAPFNKKPNARIQFWKLPEYSASTSRPRARQQDLMAQIVFDPNICSGKPTLRGTRMRVSDVLELLAGGDSPETILHDFPYLRREHIDAALSYAANVVGHRVVLAA